ncbi:alpha/beta fold hydrolase [Candidatus Contubernalis alkaliaceticus]|uniref:alpha/beta fold hydrolase n=1 Tax=Candidatus Contubernalis alkaliaceticus TaxID=338645 RepID=UPI001F4C114C|nr:alpha/beta hydrolase [Candidatus Contubernalis alkalaceticus]UNC92089.1 alpha/beta hydrolase [Candidatus Contubernalis alkalaceticus]
MQKTKKILQYIIIFITTLSVILIGTGLLYISYEKHQVRRAFAIDTVNGIETLEPVVLGEVEQWISIRGTNTQNPVLLFLHGGPGGSALPNLRHFHRELEEHFTLVNWDQRGAGKSYSVRIPEDSFTIDQFVSDTHQLTLLLIERFETDKIYLMGHSWGTIIGMKAVYQRPELYHAYFGTAQVVNPAKGEAISYHYTLESAYADNNNKAVEELRAAGAAPYEFDDTFWDKLLVQRKWLSYYGGNVHNNKNLFSDSLNLFAPEYSIIDFFNLKRGNQSSVYYLWDELLTVNLMEQVTEVEIPVYFITGRHDYIAPFELVEEYYHHLKAPSKELIWFENSAHSPIFEEIELFQQILVQKIRHEPEN